MRVRTSRLLLLALGVETFLIVASRTDLPASDALAYAENAYAIQDDPAGFFAHPRNHPFAMRVGLTVPLAVLYRAFGVDALSTSVIPVAAALAILVAVFLAVPPGKGRMFVLLFSVAAIPLVRYGSVLGVDLACTALLAWSLLLLGWRARGWTYLAAAMALWFAAFLVKESALWCAPAWIYAAVVDARSGGWRRAARAHAPALAIGLALAVGYLVLCDRIWGDPFARFVGVDHLGTKHRWSLAGQPAAAWLGRLTWGPPVLLLTTFGVALPLALVASRHVPGAARTWVVATVAILTLFWFGSASLSSYDPLPLRPRMVLPALPGVLVLAGFGAERYVRHRAAIALVIVAALVPFGLAVGPHLFPARPESAAYARLRADTGCGSVVLVCGDTRCPAVSMFHFGFAPPPGLTILDAGDFAAAAVPPGNARVRLLVHQTRARYLLTNYGDQPVALDVVEAMRLPVLTGDADVRLYDAGDGAALHATLRAVATSSARAGTPSP